jgi:tetratricopeptide (TPR) repeat protein
MSAVSWLDVGDKVASMAGALLGAMALVRDIVYRKRGVSGGDGEGRRIGQGWSRLSTGLGCMALAVVVVWLVGPVTGDGRLWLSGAGFALGGGALATVGVYRLVCRRSPFPLPDLVRVIVTYQWEDAFRHSYQYVLGSAPPLSRIYVEQKAEASLMAAAGGAGRAMTLREVLAICEHPLIVADPGTGKTTAVARVVAEQCGWWRVARASSRPAKAPYGPVVPIVVPVAVLAEQTLPEAMRSVWAGMGGRELDARLFERPPLPGVRWLVLLDGVDQVLTANERARLLTRLGNRIAEGGCAHRFLVTSRPLAFGEVGALGGVGRFTLRKFGRRDLEAFAREWTRYRAETAMAGVPGGALTAELFLARVCVGRLAPVVRVPLLATIAALLLEAERDRELPGSRTELYERFVQHLLHGRQEMLRQRERLAEDFRRYGVQGEQAWRWFDSNLVPLLEGIADAHLSAGRFGLLAEAQAWVRRRASKQLLGAVPGWEGLLRALLEATGVLVFRPTGAEFLHQSFAEYLAAGPRAMSIERQTWLADVRSPDSRSLALFVLGRSENSADTEVGLLLERRGGDACIAGEIVVDGAQVSPEMRARVVITLLDQLVAEEPTALVALQVLTDLIGEPGIRNRLESVVADAHQRPWVRAFIADALCEVTADGVPALRDLVHTPALPDGVRRWAARRLAARGVATAAEYRFLDRDGRGDDPAAAGSVLAISAFTRVLEDRSANPGDRLEAVLTLAQYDSGGAVTTWLPEVLSDLRLSQDARLDAARMLVSGTDAVWGEMLHTLASDPAGDIRVRVPILIALASEGWSRAYTSLQELIRAGGEEFVRQFPAVRAIREVTGERSAEQARGAAAGSALTINVPPRNKGFTGREALLAGLRQRMTGEVTALLPHALQGMGGVGKTQLAIEYAYRYAGDYDLICWLPAEPRAVLLACLADLGNSLGLLPSGTAPADKVATSVIDTLRRGEPYRRWLLIFDNVDQPEAIRDLVPNGPGDVLVTSRNHRWQSIADTVEVDVFTRAESLEFLHRRVPGSADDDSNRLAEELGDLPLALEQAGALLAETGMSVAEYLDLLNTEARRLLAENPPSDYPWPVAAAWSLSMARLRDQMPFALELLRLCAFFGPEPIPREWLQRGRYALSSPLREALGDPIILSRGIRELSRYALVRFDNNRKTLQVHRLIQKLLRDELSPDEAHNIRHEVHLLLAAVDPGDPEEPESWPDYHKLLAHLGPSAIAECHSADVRMLVHRVTSYLYHIGDYTTCFAEIDRALQQWRADSTEDDRDVLRMQGTKAFVLWALGQHAEAADIRESVRRRQEELFGPDHEDTLYTTAGYVADLRANGRFAAALELDETLLDRHKRVYGEHRDTFTVAHNLATDCCLVGDYRRALAIDEQNHQDRLDYYGREDNPWVLTSLGAIARDLRLAGHYAAAVRTARQAREMFEDLAQQRIIPEDHVWVLLQAKDYSVALRKIGSFPEALALAYQVHRSCQRAFGAGHPETLGAAINLGNAQRATGNLRDAATRTEDTISRYRAVWGADHPFTHGCTMNLAIVHRLLGHPEQARQLLEQTLTGLQRTVGANHHFTLTCLTNLAAAVAELGDAQTARELDEQALRQLRATLGDNHPHTLACAANLALDRRALGLHDKADELAHDTHDRHLATLGGGHPDVQDAIRGERLTLDFEPPEI